MLFMEINRFHSFPVFTERLPVKDGIEELEASLNQKKTKEQVRGFTSKLRKIIQDKVTKNSVIARY